MGEPELTRDLRSEAELADVAGRVGRAWRRAGRAPLVVGLRGELGSGKTSFVRALLRGLGYAGRVPSPTYTLLEHYALEVGADAGAVGALDVLHLDLYRLAGEAELENLGIRDWLAAADAWLFIEWIDRAPQLARRADLHVALGHASRPTARRLVLSAQSDTGNRALEDCRQIHSSNAG
jgi:tRNA threonylcarbamoyladenosine biosynthesis protein TsaE